MLHKDKLRKAWMTARIGVEEVEENTIAAHTRSGYLCTSALG